MPSGAEAGVAPTFVNPNLDVVYSEAWIGVDAENAGAAGRAGGSCRDVLTAQIVDEWAEITYNINPRTMPDHPHGTFAPCLAGSAR